MDTVWNFNQARLSTSFVWLFRKTYWGTNFSYFQSSFINKSSLFARWRKVLQYVFMKVRLDFDMSRSSWLSRVGLFILAKVGYLLNPFDATTYDLGNFHGAIIEPERMQPYRKSSHLRGEIGYLEGKKLYTTKGLGLTQMSSSAALDTTILKLLFYSQMARSFLHTRNPEISFGKAW